MSEHTLFDLPNSPEEFSVVLPPADLRRIDFSAIEFPTARRAVIEYVRTYYPDIFNDFSANNGFIMLLECLSYLAAVGSVRQDTIANNIMLPTSQDRNAVQNILEIINRPIKRQTPAVVDIAVSVRSATSTSIRIPAGLQFNVNGADGTTVTYELYRAPGDFSSDIEIPPGKRGIIGYGLEGRFATDFVAVSSGGADQELTIVDQDILADPIFVTVETSSTPVEWRQIDSLANAIPSDEVFETKFDGDDLIVLFGNDINGKAPLAGSAIVVSYRVGGGIRGRIGSGVISETRFISPDPPASAPVEVSFRNLLPSNGGKDEETIDEAKRRGPKESATIKSAVTGEDYAVLASGFNHPIFGSVLKSVATLRSSINANVVELYVLAEGPDGVPILPSEGLKQGLVSFFDEINVLTDEVRALDGALKPVDLHMEIVINRNADSGVVRDQVNKAVDGFFDVDNFDMGEGLFLSRLYETINKIDGVQRTVIVSPVDDVLPTKKMADVNSSGVGFNELIILGEKTLEFFFERAR